jgi:hypothetical protein
MSLKGIEMNTSGLRSRRQFCQNAAGALGGLWLSRFVVGAEPEAENPLPFVPGSFTLAVLPDTQHYCRAFPQHFYGQTQWIVDNAERYNIKHVLHLGDITNNNVRPHWEVARKAMYTLNGKVPYAMVPGNHDYGPNGESATRDTFMNDYFPLTEHRRQSTFGDAMEEGKIDNTYHTFRAGDHDYLILALEWAPRDRTVEWANEVVEKHREHRAILITHAYMFNDDTRYDWSKYGAQQRWNPHSYLTAKLEGGVNDGEDLWRKLILKHPNFFMTLNGHVLGDGLARLTSEASDDHLVHQMLVNYQMKPEGGEGFLRLVEFLPDDQTLQVKAYSPSLDQFKTDPQNQFVLKRTAVG